MSTFRDREKARQIALKSNRALFSAEAQAVGSYGKKSYDFCLGGSMPGENLYSGIRGEAIKYFSDRGIAWHGGERGEVPHDLPSRHLCCSQSMCVNVLFPLRDDPTLLVSLLDKLNYSVSEPLPFNPEGGPLYEPGYVAFEWIGLRNYLGEHSHGSIAPDAVRTRGAAFTSTDFAVRFTRKDGRVQIILGEWKYTEYYEKGKSKQCSNSGKDRLEVIYKNPLISHDCPIKWSLVGMKALFFDPFDQMMRLQLLARAMERNGELGASVVSVLHAAPSANRELMSGITSPGLESLGGDIHEVWRALVDSERFKGVDSGRIITLLVEHGPQRDWADYVRLRYGAMNKA